MSNELEHGDFVLYVDEDGKEWRAAVTRIYDEDDVGHPYTPETLDLALHNRVRQYKAGSRREKRALELGHPTVEHQIHGGVVAVPKAGTPTPGHWCREPKEDAAP